MHARRNVMCPNCYSDGNETNHYNEETNTYLPRIDIIPPANINVISDIDHQDGRTGEVIEMPGLGPGATVRSRRELRDKIKRAREEMWKRTEGEHTTTRPFRDDDGNIVMDEVTTKSEGFDMGELVPVEKKPEVQNDPKDPGFAEQGRPLREVEAELDRIAGALLADVVEHRRLEVVIGPHQREQSQQRRDVRDATHRGESLGPKLGSASPQIPVVDRADLRLALRDGAPEVRIVEAGALRSLEPGRRAATEWLEQTRPGGTGSRDGAGRGRDRGRRSREDRRRKDEQAIDHARHASGCPSENAAG